MAKHGQLTVVTLVIYGSNKSQQASDESKEANSLKFILVKDSKLKFMQKAIMLKHDINLGGLELGMFSRALKYEDIERMEIIYQTGTPDLVYFPYKDKTTEGLDNEYQSTRVSEETKSLYIVIDPKQTVDDVYGEFF